jgi:hypothetical protein
MSIDETQLKTLWNKHKNVPAQPPKPKKLKKWQIKANEVRMSKGKAPRFIDPKETLIERIERKQVAERRRWLLSQPTNKSNMFANTKPNCHRAKDWYSA